MMRELWSRVVGFARRTPLDREFDAEIENHLAMLVEENMARGMNGEDARHAALRSLGNVTQLKERQREARGLIWIETLFADLKYAARMLRMNPGFTLVSVLTLTLGIGVVTTVFTAYNAVALKPLPVADPSHVVRFERWFVSGNRGDIQYGFSYPEYQYLLARDAAFAGLVVTSWPLNVTAAGGEKFQGQLVSANYFGEMGVPARIGRTFLPEEDRTPDGNAVLVLSYSGWQRRFHGDAEIAGRVITLNGTAFTIVGVAAPGFSGTSVAIQTPDFWAPVSMQAQLAPGYDRLSRPDFFRFQILARVKSSTSVARAEAETAVLVEQFATTYEPKDRTSTVTLQKTALLGNTEDIRFQESVVAIMLIVGMVLLVGCANIANMLLARGAARQREISVRLALGASRGRVIRQLLTESLLLSILGGAGGLLLSVWTSRLLWVQASQFIHERISADIVIGIDLSPDIRVVAYATALSLFAGFLFGLSPALQFSRPDLTTALKAEGGFGAGWKRSRLRSFLIAAQVTVSMVLLISAGLLMRGLERAQAADPGFETQSVYRLMGEFGGVIKAAAMQQRLFERLRTVNEIRNVAMGTMPLLGTWTPYIVVGAERGRTLASCADDSYFDLLGIPLLRGRRFTKAEADQSANVSVVSESTARKFWPGQDPIGKQFKLDMDWRGTMAAFEVIGVARDVRYANLSRVDPAHVYLTPKAATACYSSMMVRTQGDSRRAIAAIRRAANSIDPGLGAGIAMLNLEEGPVYMQRSIAAVSAMFAAILAVLALVLAGVGIYGVMSYLVNQRVKEIGVRIALGARAEHVLANVVMRGLRPVTVGLILGIVGAAGLSAVLHSTLALPGSPDFFYGVPFYDPATFIGLSIFLVAVAGLASAVPAKKALKVDPMVALRYE